LKRLLTLLFWAIARDDSHEISTFGIKLPRPEENFCVADLISPDIAVGAVIPLTHALAAVITFVLLKNPWVTRQHPHDTNRSYTCYPPARSFPDVR